MLTIYTTNTSGLSLSAVIDKVDVYGAQLATPLRWNNSTEAFEATSGVDIEDAYVPLTEGSTPFLGSYSVEINGIDSTAEIVQVYIIDTDSEQVIGSEFFTPANAETPVVLNLEVTEDRSN